MKKFYVMVAFVATLISSFVFATDNSTKAPTAFRLPHGITSKDYAAQTIIVKMKPDFRSDCRTNSITNEKINTALLTFGVGAIKKLYPNHQQPLTERNSQGQKLVDLSLIYEIKYTSPVTIEKAINQILQTGTVLYAEPRYLYHFNYTPNDPSITNSGQYFLNKIQAYNAWNISQGDTNIVIGIVDSGTDWDHPDLAANVKINYNDPINGVDDDGDGYIDNYRGWDMSMNDNNPMVDMSDHGSHVSGCADAVTDNGVGVASPGFKCKFLPVKCADSQSTTTIDHGYEGIVYAADHGCSIINCSWGGGAGGQYGQDVITYASINKNALVCISAGNTYGDDAQYPAAYNYAFSVASTNGGDQKSNFSTYNYTVDICAPGSSIYSTVYNNTYTTYSGTSMASPITAGCAAIVKSMNPTYSGLQIGEQLRMTADNIYIVAGNGGYLNKLGGGRVNLYRALTESPESVRMENINVTDGNDDAFVVGDTLKISGDVVNYLAPSTNLTVTLSSTSGYVTVLNNSINPGALATLAAYNNSSSPFTVKINAGTPLNSVVDFQLLFTDGVYTTKQFFKVTLNVDYINVAINDVATSITSKGKIFYNSDLQLDGLGFIYSNINLIYDGGLMIGKPGAVSDVIRDAGVNDADFVSQQVVQTLIPTVKSDFDLFGKFNDNAAATPLHVLVSHKAYAWTSAGSRKFVEVEYNIKNTGTTAINSMYAGLFCDWDIPAYANNKADVDNTRKMGYCYSTDANGLWAGVKLLTQTPFKNYSIDNIAGGGGGTDITTAYSSAQKYTTLSTNRAQAGMGSATGNDVCQVVSSGPFNVAAGDSVIVAFALIAGNNLADLQSSADSAQVKYDGYSTGVIDAANSQPSFTIYPNPAYDNLLISFTGNISKDASIELINALGQTVRKIAIDKQVSGLISYDIKYLEKGIYICRYNANGKSVNRKLVVE
jgi:subtilisin family serine protease